MMKYKHHTSNFEIKQCLLTFQPEKSFLEHKFETTAAHQNNTTNRKYLTIKSLQSNIFLILESTKFKVKLYKLTLL